MLLAAVLTTPTGFEELPIGSVFLLAFLIYEAAEGVVYGGNLVDVPFMARAARYEHHLFWPSPADTPAIQRQMWALRIWPVWFGVLITAYLVLALILVSWDSPLVPPLALGFVVVGYLTTHSSLLSITGGAFIGSFEGPKTGMWRICRVASSPSSRVATSCQRTSQPNSGV